MMGLVLPRQQVEALPHGPPEAPRSLYHMGEGGATWGEAQIAFKNRALRGRFLRCISLAAGLGLASVRTPENGHGGRRGDSRRLKIEPLWERLEGQIDLVRPQG